MGTLFISLRFLEYQGDKLNLKIESVKSVTHTKMGGDLNHNWVKVDYESGDKIESVYFSQAWKLGLGNLLGGSSELFETLRKNFL